MKIEMASRFPKLDQFEKKKQFSPTTFFRVFKHVVSFSCVQQQNNKRLNNKMII